MKINPGDFLHYLYDIYVVLLIVVIFYGLNALASSYASENIENFKTDIYDVQVINDGSAHYSDKYTEDHYMNNLTGNLYIVDNKNGTVNIIINLSPQNENSFTMAFYSVPLVKTYFVTPDNKKILGYMTIDDPSNGLFSTIDMLKNGDGRISLTFSTMVGQYHIEGIIKKPLSIKHGFENKLKVEGASNGTIEIVKGRPEQIVAIQTATGAEYVIPVGEEKLPTKVITFKNISKSSDTNSNGIMEPYGPIVPKIYGLIHDLFPGSNPCLSTSVPNWMMQTGIFTSVYYKSNPSYDEIKSDLSYYNTYYYYDETRSKILAAYHISAHRVDNSYEPDCTLVMADGVHGLSVADFNGPSWAPGTGIWQSHSNYFVAPQDTIILGHNCNGLWDGKDANGNQVSNDFPEMADSWVSHGASGYVSFCEYRPPMEYNTFISTFWYNLCVNRKTVDSARADACDSVGLPQNKCQTWGNKGATL